MSRSAALTFPFDVPGWLGPGVARSMTPAERGVYIDLLAYQCQKGFIPAADVAEPEMLARMCNTTEDDFRAIWKRIARKFQVTANGDFYNAKLAETINPPPAVPPPLAKVIALPRQQQMFGVDSSVPIKEKKKPRGNPEIGELCAFYCQEWVTTHRPDDGKPPKLSRADKGQAATLVRDHGLNRAKEFVARYLRDCDAWFASKGHPLGLILRKVNEYRTGESKPATKGRGHARATASYAVTSDGTDDL